MTDSMTTAAGRESGLAALLKRKPWQFLTSYALKWIAIITMAVDHVGFILVWEHYLDVRLTIGGANEAALIYDVYNVMRAIGRIAFPLFCFLLAEGFHYTHSKPKYAFRLFLFALISELPYDWGLYGTGLEFTEHQNVMFTLLVSFLALWGAQAASRALKFPAWAEVIATIAFICAGAWVAEVTNMSYHAFGVLMVGALYLARKSHLLQFALGAALVWWYCVEHGSYFELPALISLGLLFFYNGKRGRSMKWFFYVFYPAHILIIGLLHMWLF